MKHNAYFDYPFCKAPLEFDKNSEKEFLSYCLGATLYMPATREFCRNVTDKQIPGLTSMVMCFEDACKLEDVPRAEENSIHMLDVLAEKLGKGEITYADLPLLIFRVRNLDQFKHLASLLKREHIKVLIGFNFQSSMRKMENTISLFWKN